MRVDLQCRKLLANGEKQPVLQRQHTAEVKCELHACWLESSPDFSFSKCSDIYPASPACSFALAEPPPRAHAAITIQYSLTQASGILQAPPACGQKRKQFWCLTEERSFSVMLVYSLWHKLQVELSANACLVQLFSLAATGATSLYTACLVSLWGKELVQPS